VPKAKREIAPLYPVANWDGTAVLPDGTKLTVGDWETICGIAVEITTIDEYGVWGHSKRQTHESHLYWDHCGNFKGLGPGSLYNLAKVHEHQTLHFRPEGDGKFKWLTDKELKDRARARR